METILKHASPILLQSIWQQCFFLLLPALGALIGAFLCQGSFLRIIGAAMGAASRDMAIMLLVINGWMVPNNPHWDLNIAFMLLFLSASSAALMSCLAPYRGKILLINSAIGGFAGQFLLAYILGVVRRPDPLEESVQELLSL